MAINVLVEGFGKYQIEHEKVSELLDWLTRNQGVKINEKNTIQEVENNKFTGRELLTESFNT